MSRLADALARLPEHHPGPGGAVAVLHRGEVLARHAWGYADAERRLRFTPESRFLVCSITKQFTSALALDALDELDEGVRAALPGLGAATPAARHLLHNQSGLRDYWALAMLCGADAEARFGQAEADWLIPRTGSHFAPGTRYAYSNGGFRLVSDLLARRAGRPFAELLRERVLRPAGMETAWLHPETGESLGTVGYEGSIATGFRPAVNRIRWTGDAGLSATLEDMIAWERRIDATRDDPASLYRRLSAPVAFADGTPAQYGFGLRRDVLHGRAATSHAGALRGWRSFRAYLPGERLSVVVLFNHMADPREAALRLVAAALDLPAPRPPAPAPDLAGRFLEPETGLAVSLARDGDALSATVHGMAPERLHGEGIAAANEGMQVAPDGEFLSLSRPGENISGRLRRVEGSPPPLQGRFFARSLAATLHCESDGGGSWAAFEGRFGTGTMTRLVPFGAETWLLPCHRALDVSPPGDWTIEIRPGGLTVGCWLARGIAFDA